ncbi:MAG: lytic transglycosylase domain-containing protein [Deltaproteobacteria bacterium]|nr:lytic transglycosylase domain-containing protein [Deltaproteobacteria bacterium]
MSIDPLKVILPQKISLPATPPKSIQTGQKLFEEALSERLKQQESLKNSMEKAEEAIARAQIQLMQGLFVEDDEKLEGHFSVMKLMENLTAAALTKSQIIDRYVAIQQPSLLDSRQPGRDGIEKMIDQVAARISLAPELIRSVVAAESSFNPTAVSPVGAQGLMQLMPETAQELGVKDSFDPQQNLLGGSRYLKQLLDKYNGDLDHALAAYNWGQGNVDRRGLENMPEETRNYLAKIKTHLKKQST